AKEGEVKNGMKQNGSRSCADGGGAKLDAPSHPAAEIEGLVLVAQTTLLPQTLGPQSWL
ncbi:hypothetical protein Ancab_020462, partial [Ancistrocladus abbreviatus]